MSYLEVVPHPNGGFAFTQGGRSATQQDSQFTSPLDAYDFALMLANDGAVDAFDGIAMSPEANDWVLKNKP